MENRGKKGDRRGRGAILTHPSVPGPERAAVLERLGSNDAQHGLDAFLRCEDAFDFAAWFDV